MFVAREGNEVIIVRLSSHLSNLLLLNYETVPVRFLRTTNVLCFPFHSGLREIIFVLERQVSCVVITI